MGCVNKPQVSWRAPKCYGIIPTTEELSSPSEQITPRAAASLPNDPDSPHGAETTTLIGEHRWTRPGETLLG
ncbi:unnamed protein product [Merluccius merluccius]